MHLDVIPAFIPYHEDNHFNTEQPLCKQASDTQIEMRDLNTTLHSSTEWTYSTTHCGPLDHICSGCSHP